MPRVNVNSRNVQMLQEYLGHKTFPRTLFALWRRDEAAGRLNPNLAWTQTDIVRLDPDIFWIMGTLTRMDNPQIQYEAAVVNVLRNFAGISGLDANGNNIMMTYEEAQDERNRLVRRYFDFLTNTQTDALDSSNADDLEKMFMLTQAFSHLDTLRSRYPDVYRDWLQNNPAKEDLLDLRRQQAETLGEQMQAAADAYFTAQAQMNGAALNPFQGGFFGSTGTGSEIITEMSGQLSAQLAQKQSARVNGTPIAAGVNLRLPADLKVLANFKDSELTQIRNEDIHLSTQIVENMFEALTPPEVGNDGVIRGGKRDQKLDKEDLIFINGKTLREYTLEHLPANSRTDTDVKNYSGALLVRAMQEGTNRIAFAQVSSMADGRYDVTVHPVKLDLKDCQPEIKDDESYGSFRRKYLNWGPFRCKTRQEKADSAYSDPKLIRREDGLKERLNEEIRTGRRDALFLEARERIEKCVSDTRACERRVASNLGTIYKDGDTRDLLSFANMLICENLDLPMDQQDRVFPSQLEEMVTAFYSPNMEARKVYLDKMGDFLDSFDPDQANPDDPKDMFRMTTFLRLAQTLNVRSKQYPEWFHERYPTPMDRERYFMQTRRMIAAGAVWEKRGVELTGKSPNIGRFRSMESDAIEPLKDISRQLMNPERYRTLALKLPASAKNFMDASTLQLNQYLGTFDPSNEFVESLSLICSTSDESYNILGGSKEDIFYVDGMSLKDYANQLSGGQSRIDYNKVLLHAMVTGGHHIDLVRLAPDAEGKWDLLTTPIRLDLSACEARREDGMTNTAKANETFRNDPDRQRRIGAIRAGLKEKIASATAAENQLRQRKALPPVKLNESLGIQQNLQERSMDELRAEWRRMDAERVRQNQALENGTQNQQRQTTQNRTQNQRTAPQNGTPTAPAQNGNAAAPAGNGTPTVPVQNGNAAAPAGPQPTRTATNFGAIVGAENGAAGNNRPGTGTHTHPGGQQHRQPSQRSM